MPLFGAHMSIAGGLHNALWSAHKHQCHTVQLFTAAPQIWPVVAAPAEPPEKNPQWQGKPLSPENITTFRRVLKETRLRFATAHDCYLINLASPNPTLYRRSVEAFIVELQRAEALGLTYLVTHPGAATDGDEARGIERIATALDEIHCRCPNFQVQVLLETTAGQGTCLGHRFEHLADMLKLLAAPQRVGVCLDTCHVFAAGYALSPLKEYRATLRAFDKLIGLKRLRCFHLNDSLKPLGSRVDRHAHIGRGCLGLEPFRLLVNDYRFRARPMILETPKEEGDDDDMDTINLATLRGLVGQSI